MNLKIRQANIKDAKFVYSLRNDFISRKNSLDNKKIKYANHLGWFKKQIDNKKNKIFIVYKNLLKISYIRFDKKDFFIRVSIAINKKFRKKGLSYDILRLAEKKLNQNAVFIADVNKNHTASLKLFKKLNYAVVEKRKNFLKFIKIFQKRNKFNNYSKFIREIENTRKANNVNWMDVLRVAFSHSPKETSNIFKKIFKSDKKINHLSKKMLMFKK